jgi:uncharacterized protein (DUF4415 family)
MKKRAPLIDADNEIRELGPDDIQQFRPADQVLPEQLQRDLGLKVRGPQKTPTKIPTTIRLSPEVSAAFRATGPGWQTRIDNALKDWLSTHALAHPRG